MYKILASLLIVTSLAASALPAQARSWQVAPTNSTLGFSGSFDGDPFQGRFGRFQADITYDQAALDQSRFDVTVDLASVDTRSSDRDQTLLGADFFDTAQFPQAHFVSDRFERDADGRVLAHGTLELHGMRQPVTLDVTFKPTAAGATLDVATTLQRLDYKLGSSNDWAGISKAIKVQAHLELH